MLTRRGFLKTASGTVVLPMITTGCASPGSAPPAVEDVERMGGLIPDAKVVICENGSHLSLYDDQAAYFDALVPFVLDATDS